jgi:hypothetical protein
MVSDEIRRPSDLPDLLVGPSPGGDAPVDSFHHECISGFIQRDDD